MKKAKFTLLSGSELEVEYDPGMPCRMCGEPVVEASTSGTVICPWCDSGINRDGTKWSSEDHCRMLKRWQRNKHLNELEW